MKVDVRADNGFGKGEGLGSTDFQKTSGHFHFASVFKRNILFKHSDG